MGLVLPGYDLPTDLSRAGLDLHQWKWEQVEAPLISVEALM